MPRLSANLSFLWPDRPFLDRIDAAAAAGFRAVECHWPYDLPAARIADRLLGRGVEMVVVNAPAGDLGRGEYGLGALPGREREFDDATDLALEYALGYALALRCPAVHCMAGSSRGSTGTRPGRPMSGTSGGRRPRPTARACRSSSSR